MGWGGGGEEGRCDAETHRLFPFCFKQEGLICPGLQAAELIKEGKEE